MLRIEETMLLLGWRTLMHLFQNISASEHRDTWSPLEFIMRTLLAAFGVSLLTPPRTRVLVKKIKLVT